MELDDHAGNNRFELSAGDAGASTCCVLDHGVVKGRGDGLRQATTRGVGQVALSGVYQPMRAGLPLAECIEVDTAEEIGRDSELDAVTALTGGCHQSEGEVVEWEVERLRRGSAGGRGEIARVADLHLFCWCA